jgi:hypothetical protein
VAVECNAGGSLQSAACKAQPGGTESELHSTASAASGVTRTEETRTLAQPLATESTRTLAAA